MPATFYYDVMSPYAYLAAARIDQVLREPARWQPVLLGGLFAMSGRSSWAVGDPARRREGMAEIERRAERLGLPPVRWPDPWPTSSLTAMRIAIHARHEGRERPYANAAFHAAFAEGADLGDRRHALAAAEAAGLDTAEVERAIAGAAVKDELRVVTEAAHACGVIGVPSVAAGGQVFFGDDRLEEAAAALPGG